MESNAQKGFENSSTLKHCKPHSCLQRDMVKISSSESQQELLFTPKETAKLRDVAELYAAVKVFILFGEEISPQNLTLPQILKELRDAFDHFMRVVAAKTNISEVNGEEYVEKNLDKIFGHVFRCAYDTLDWVSIILRDRIQFELTQYSASAIAASLPTYYATIRPRLESKIPQQIARIRGLKDIGVPEQKSILEYTDYVAEIRQYWEQIVSVKPSLTDYSHRERRAKIRERVIYALIGAAITGIAIFLSVSF